VPFYKRFFEVSSDLMCVISPTHFIEVNPAFIEKLGYTREELLSRPLLDFVHHEDVDRTRRSAAKNWQWPEGFEHRVVCKNGEIRWLLWITHPDVDAGGEVHAVGCDVTSRKFIENQLGRYVIEMRRAKEEAEVLAYAASHDLQEPLRTISNWAAIVLEDYREILPADGIEALGFVIEAAKRGRELVNDLLQLSRVQTTKIECVDVNAVVDAAVLDLEYAVRDSGAQITRDDLPQAWADAGLLRSLMKNLLSNALKFSKPGSIPRVHVGGSAEPEASHYWVQDEGIGIDPLYKELVFRVFKRLDQSRPGTGIGLAICQKIVNLHRGKIWIDSVPGAGCTVHFTVAHPDQPDVSSSSHPPGGRSPSRRQGDTERDAVDEESSASSLRLRRHRGPALLAEGGILRDRRSSRPSSVGSELAKGLRLRGAGNHKD
jgi:PAS domain S-box-containing protein